jgi:hypothetical protein
MRRRNPSVYGRLSFFKIAFDITEASDKNHQSFLDREVTFHGQPHSPKQIFVFLIIRMQNRAFHFG